MRRDRHGRGIRQTILSRFLLNARRGSDFEQIVAGACEYLQGLWPDELAELQWQVQDAPVIGADAKSVRRWAVRRDQMTIVLYRLPIERLGHYRRTDELQERIRIEENVFAAVGHLIGKDPWELVPGRYRE